MLYFAYGSNLSIQNRIKNKINIIKVKNYILKGYKICFRDPYGDPDLEKSSKNFVPGVLYKLNSIEEMKLDKYENFPLYYKKTFIKKPDIMFYEMNIKSNYSKANPVILNYIISGYRENNIPLSSFNY